jgi:hypothetical protein
MVTTPYATTSTAPGAHQCRGNLRISATATMPPIAAVTAPIPALFATSDAQSGQDCVASPTSSERARIQALTGSPVTTSSSEIPAAAAAPPSSGRRSRRLSKPRGGRQASTASVPMPIPRPTSPSTRCRPRKSSARSSSWVVK